MYVSQSGSAVTLLCTATVMFGQLSVKGLELRCEKNAGEAQTVIIV